MFCIKTKRSIFLLNLNKSVLDKIKRGQMMSGESMARRGTMHGTSLKYSPIVFKLSAIWNNTSGSAAMCGLAPWGLKFKQSRAESGSRMNSLGLIKLTAEFESESKFTLWKKLHKTKTIDLLQSIITLHNSTPLLHVDKLKDPFQGKIEEAVSWDTFLSNRNWN